MHYRLMVASILACLAVSGCARPDVPVPQVAEAWPAPPIRVAPMGAQEHQSGEPTSFEPLAADAGAFNKCASCHSLKPGQNGIGPSLAGVFGKPAARDPAYRYSDALRTSGLVWDAATLDRFLTRPRDLVPGNKMTFAGLKDPAQRAQIIAFIERY